MTAARQQRKRGHLALGHLGLGLRMAICLLAAALAFGSSPAKAGAEDRLVVDPASGLAISGFDPVAYFSHQKAVLGRPDLELSHNGAVWRFVNEGNRAAFASHPDVYTPRFGGYDPVSVERGASVPGHPQIWAVGGDRLYLFYDAAARRAFVVDPARYVASAERQWPTVARSIGR